MKQFYTLLAILTVGSGFAQLNLLTPQPICHPGDCTILETDFNPVHEATSYTVGSIPYQALFPYTGGTVLDNSNNDTFAPVFTLPFNFCFYGQSYNQVLVGPNGVITFDIASFPPAPQNCPWSFSNAIPSPSFPIKNAIYGVFQDTDIRTTANGGAVTNAAVQNVNYYIGGTAPYRYFVVNFNELPTFSCGTSAGLQTSQVVLYETTNVIDVYVLKRTPCNSWNGGRGVIGIQNAGGTVAVVPPSRNTGTWSATNEAWRFTPAGNELPATYTWSVDGFSVPEATANSFTYCPETGGNVSVTIDYVSCSGQVVSISDSMVIAVEPPLGVAPLPDLYTCGNAGMGVFDLSSVPATVLGALSPMDYEVSIYNTFSDAENATANIISPTTPFNGVSGQALYVRIEDVSGGTACYEIVSFTLHVSENGWPLGESEQFFTDGQTLADLDIEGPGIEWYADAEGGEPLPTSTPLVNDTTYYAESDEAPDCNGAGRMTSTRFAVTVYDVTMGVPDFGVTMQVGPNPTMGMVSIKSTAAMSRITLFNLLGQKVFDRVVESTDVSLDVSHLPSGTYLVKAWTSQKVLSSKIIKE